MEAVDFIRKMQFSKTVKWYREEGLKTSTIEAKVKQDGHRYSVEFDTNGRVEDIECTIKLQDLSLKTKERIQNHLDRAHSKVKIMKVQIQYSGEERDLQELLTKEGAQLKLTIKYELVVKCKSAEEYEDIEYLFSEQGEMEKKSIIIPDNTDYLEY